MWRRREKGTVTRYCTAAKALIEASEAVRHGHQTGKLSPEDFSLFRFTCLLLVFLCVLIVKTSTTLRNKHSTMYEHDRDKMNEVYLC